MKHKKQTTRQGIAFLLALAAMFLLTEFLLRAVNPIARSSYFPRNDHEKTVALHGTSVFDKVVYGSSPVVAAYREADSSSGYVELGIVYGKVTYLLEMLERGIITVNEEIVLGLSSLLFLDTLATDHRYIWHQGPFEPYVYFYRDRLNTFIVDAVDGFLRGDFHLRKYEDMDKWLYFGVLSDENLNKVLASHKERFWGLDITDFADNLQALGALADYCVSKDIRLRAVWMPVSPKSPAVELYDKLAAEVNAILSERGVEVYDMTNALPVECFHDFGHLNYEVGAVEFTKELDIWLGS